MARRCGDTPEAGGGVLRQRTTQGADGRLQGAHPGKGKHPPSVRNRLAQLGARTAQKSDEQQRESRTHSLGNLRNSPVWHTVRAEDGTKYKKAALETQLYMLSAAIRRYSLGKADQREDSTALLKDSKQLNSGKRSCPPQDTRGAWVPSRAHSTGKVDQHSNACGERRTRCQCVRGGGKDWSAPWLSASPRASTLAALHDADQRVCLHHLYRLPGDCPQARGIGRSPLARALPPEAEKCVRRHPGSQRTHSATPHHG